MAYDRFEREQRWREGRSEHNEDRDPRAWDRDYDRNEDDRGFFGRMGDEVRSWFGDEEAERRDRSGGEDDWTSRQRSRSSFDEPARPMEWHASDRDYSRSYDRDFDRSMRDEDRYPARSSSNRDRDPYRRTGIAGSRERSSHDDHHYERMRRRQAEELDREYDEFRRERASQFESEFGSWRDRRQSKRQLLSVIREHMEVVGSDEQQVGTVDRIAGDRIILARSDPDSGGVHHSLSCSDVDRVEGDRVILDCSAEKARERWRDDSRSRALFEREDQGRSGPHVLDRSFSGTYR